MNKSEISQKPVFSGDGYGYGGGFVVTCPIIIPHAHGKSTCNRWLALELGEAGDVKLTAEFLRDAINEKLDRDFRDGG